MLNNNYNNYNIRILRNTFKKFAQKFDRILKIRLKRYKKG